MSSSLLNSYTTILSHFLSFKSVSTDPNFKLEMSRTAEWLRVLFEENGLVTEVWSVDGANPVVYADYRLPIEDNAEAETVLVYGHYDVQPAEEADGWKGDPFRLREEDGRLVGRGVVDNKGQILIHMASVFKLIKEGKLKHNVKFLIEGDEETGGDELSKLVVINKEKLKADHVLISDGEIVGEFPTIEVSLRGGFNATVTFETANTNLHSGIFGGAAPNAAMELSKFVSGLFDSKNVVTIPGFYDDVDEITSEQLANNKILLEASNSNFDSTGIKKFLMEQGNDFFTQTGLRPSISVTGFKSGYVSEGYANIVPAKAEVRLNFRLVASQDPKKVIEVFKKYVEKVTPDYVKASVSVHGPHYPIKIDVGSPKVTQVRDMLLESHGKKALSRFVGGAIPAILEFKSVLGVDSILVPLCNDDCNMHGVEENFKIHLVEKGLDFSERFFSTTKKARV